MNFKEQKSSLSRNIKVAFILKCCHIAEKMRHITEKKIQTANNCKYD